MPIFEYGCRACGHEFERLVLRTTDTVACPACRSPDIEKKLSCFGFKSGGSKSPAAQTSSAKSGCGSCTSRSCASCH